MKIHLISDVHLEFGKWPKEVNVNDIDCDVHVLAGDIGVGLQGVEWALNSFTKPVVYICGNHEFYGQRPMQKLIDEVRAKCDGTHVHFLDNDAHDFTGLDSAGCIQIVRFLGTTLWTDFEVLGAEITQRCIDNAAQEISDYANIILGYGPGGFGKNKRMKLTPRAALSRHHEARDFLERNLPFYRDPDSQYDKVVVVSHHAPSPKCLFGGGVHQLSDACYASELEYLVRRTDLWCHGHIHGTIDITLDDEVRKCGDARIMCNPRGYVGHELNPGFNPQLVVEV